MSQREFEMKFFLGAASDRKFWQSQNGDFPFGSATFQNAASLKRKIRELGGDRVHRQMTLRRFLFDLPNGADGFARVRQEHGGVKLTVKTFADKRFPKETEIQVPNMDVGVRFLSELGLKASNYQETRRETWSLPGVREVAFDRVPGLPPYVEVDCASLSALNKALKALGFRAPDGFYGSFDRDFERLYGIPRSYINKQLEQLTFGSVRALLKPQVQRNLELFMKWSDPAA
jgi:adenylate cyclase class IV